VGLANCTGDIVAFPDDDCEYQADTLQKVVDFFTQSPRYGFYTCNTIDNKLNLSDFKAKKHNSEISIYNIRTTGISFTIFVRKNCIGNFRFDTQLGIGAPYGSAEETDLLLFLLKHQNRGFYHAGTYIYHCYKNVEIDRSFNYGKGLGAVYNKAINLHKYYPLFYIFAFILLKNIFSICFFSYKRESIASLKGRLYGFFYYKFKKKIVINGDFFFRKITGIERLAYEITVRLDRLIQPNEIAILIPSNTPNVPLYKNIEVIRYKKFNSSRHSHIWWQMFPLQYYFLTHRKYMILDFENTCLPFAPGIVFLHDIYCKFFPEDFTSLRDKIVRWYNQWQYWFISKKAKRIITVSQFSKQQIIDAYQADPEKISVIFNGWDHFRHILPDYGIFKEYSELTQKPFYFSLGSLSKRKNLSWIVEYASKHQDMIFAISGTELPTAQAHITVSLSNIILLGYLNDEKVKALMSECKAFIQPSYYEGFGIPPLEALSCGAKIIVSNAASLPEIYGNTAHYINPFNTNVDLDALLQEPVEPPDRILQKYTYDTAAHQVYELIQQIY
jgi:glycosyltransferase involved in cell wall biosynthesis